MMKKKCAMVYYDMFTAKMMRDTDLPVETFYFFLQTI